VANHEAMLAKIIRLNFNFTASLQPAPFIFELQGRMTSLELNYMLDTIALFRLMPSLSYGTYHGILPALLSLNLL
jgi:hypothetical protein